MNASKPIDRDDLPAIEAALVGKYIHSVRVTMPGSIITQDYKPHRLWIKLDDEGVVRKVTLG